MTGGPGTGESGCGDKTGGLGGLGIGSGIGTGADAGTGRPSIQVETR